MSAGGDLSLSAACAVHGMVKPEGERRTGTRVHVHMCRREITVTCGGRVEIEVMGHRSARLVLSRAESGALSVSVLETLIYLTIFFP